MQENSAGGETRCWTRAEMLAWAREETDRRHREFLEWKNPVLHPVEWYPADRWLFRRHTETDPQPRPRDLQGIRAAIGGGCCGWSWKPTAERVAAAVRNRNAEDHYDSVAVEVVLTEASVHELEHMLMNGAFSVQDVAWWMHEKGGGEVQGHRKLAYLNVWARDPKEAGE